MFDEVTAPEAPDVFKAKSKAKNVVFRPVDSLLDNSFIQTMLHEYVKFFES